MSAGTLDDTAGADPYASAPGPVREYRRWRSSHLLGGPDWSADSDPAGSGDEVHGPHVALRRSGFEPIEWCPVAGPVERARVVAHTCECLATLYELCALGGAYFVRRTVRGPDGEEVAESPRTVLRRTEERWFRLLRGRAR